MSFSEHKNSMPLAGNQDYYWQVWLDLTVAYSASRGHRRMRKKLEILPPAIRT